MLFTYQHWNFICQLTIHITTLHHRYPFILLTYVLYIVLRNTCMYHSLFGGSFALSCFSQSWGPWRRCQPRDGRASGRNLGGLWCQQGPLPHGGPAAPHWSSSSPLWSSFPLAQATLSWGEYHHTPCHHHLPSCSSSSEIPAGFNICAYVMHEEAREK